jgi:hypothetical protein
VALCSSPSPIGGEPCTASKITLARLFDVARCHRENLVVEVEEEEVDSNVPPQMELATEMQLVPEVEVVGNDVSHPRCISLFFSKLIFQQILDEQKS